MLFFGTHDSISVHFFTSSVEAGLQLNIVLKIVMKIVMKTSDIKPVLPFKFQTEFLAKLELCICTGM